MINTQGYAVAVTKLRKNCLFLSGRGIFFDCPYRTEAVTDNVIIGVKFNR